MILCVRDFPPISSSSSIPPPPPSPKSSSSTSHWWRLVVQSVKIIVFRVPNFTETYNRHKSHCFEVSIVVVRITRNIDRMRERERVLNNKACINFLDHLISINLVLAIVSKYACVHRAPLIFTKENEKHRIPKKKTVSIAHTRQHAIIMLPLPNC